ncbi:MAG: TonB-dependent receptor, partial [Bacteroidota bacterium]|nr:TonB-dependent receptor [Bacteroidota bacterium]
MKISTFLMVIGMLIFWGTSATANNRSLNIKPVSSEIGSNGTLQQQRVRITGKVTDKDGNGLVGVTVSIKGTTRGGLTDVNGNYSIPLNPGDKVLVFTFIGMVTKEINIGNQSVINMQMEALTSTLDEVVVVAYGTQKKESVIGSVTTVRPSELKVPSSNLTTALAGRIAGIISYQTSGEPGLDNAQFFINGATTFGYKKDPLILIDGMEFTATDMARIQTDDIESFTIMKDATANALYGARGANGVILITTKEGKEGKAKISFRAENSYSSNTKSIQFADPITYMKLANEANLTRNPLAALPYSQSKIDNTIAGLNPIVFPTTDWMKELIKPVTNNQRYNLNLSGGGQIATYYIAAGLTQDNGNLRVDHRNNFNTNIDLKNYNLRSNINIKVTKTTTALVRLYGSFDEYTGPIDGGSGMYRKVVRTNPVLFKPYYAPDSLHQFTNHILFGNSELGAPYENPYADMVQGYKQSSSSLMLAQFEVKQDLDFITPGLSIRGMMNTNRSATFAVSRKYKPFFYAPSSYDRLSNTFILSDLNPNVGTDYLDYNQGGASISSVFYGEVAANYTRTLKKNTYSGMLITTMRNSLNSNGSDLQSSLAARNIGISGRGTYSYDNRFFGEFNFGYNGSERFYKTQRFGFFPSAGGAWYLSNEKFFEPYRKVFNKIKIRGNYGLVGNDAIGSASDRFFYLSSVNMNNSSYSSSFGTDGGYSVNGISVDRYSNEAITWETAKNSTFGLELGLFDKLNIIAEYFTEHRSNILMKRASIPQTMGLEGATPQANVGETKSKAIDISLDYSDNIGKDFSISVRGNFTYAHNIYQAYEEPNYTEPWTYKVGYSTSQKWGYIAERLFIDDEEVRSSPTQNFGGSVPTMAGDIKYKDVNGDGIIDSKDMVPIGNPTTPEIVYGFGFSAKYKNFDFSAFAQGEGLVSFWIDVPSTAPFISYKY